MTPNIRANGTSAYSRDVLSQPSPRATEPAPSIPATGDVVAEDPLSGFCGAVVACSSTAVTLEDRHGNRRNFPLAPGAFLVDGRPATLTRPVRTTRAPQRSTSGSLAVAGHRARVARAAQIWVEGIHDATLIERVWGHDLRVEGIVVQPISGLDNLHAELERFGPSTVRRVGVLADHLVPGSKEQRIADAVANGPHGAHVLVTGHPYVDIWQAVRPESIGIAGWPDVPRGIDFKQGVCAALGISDPITMWGKVNGAVRSFRDINTPLVTAVETLIDFVTAEQES